MSVVSVAEAFAGASWWTIGLSAALAARAVLVLGRGVAGASWRSLLAVVAGVIVAMQLALRGPDPALLPLHAVAAVVVALLPWERPHPEAAPLRLGRHRRRHRPLWPRSLLLLTLTAAAAANALLA